MKPMLHVQLHPPVILELLGMDGQGMHEWLTPLAKPSLQTMSHGYGPANGVRPGFSHPNELGSGIKGQDVHLGAVVGPQVVMSVYCRLLHVVS
jgi:hypothetical protein